MLLFLTITKFESKIGLIFAIFTNYFFHILEIKITDEDSDQSRNVALKLLSFPFIYIL